MRSGDRTFDLDSSIDLCCYVIVMVGYCGELWLCLVS